MCDLCTRNKKVFTHEHELFTDKELEKHMRHGDDRPGAIDQTGFKGHPLCGFCGERFYDDDKLYEHCRNKHERCFICDRRDSRQPHYYLNYNALEEHFRKDHFPCLDRECLEKKFVVFESELDLKAHQLSEHADSLSKDVRRDARVVDMSGFDYRPTYQQERRGGGSSGREGRGRGRNPTAERPVATPNPTLRRDEIAFQRQLAIRSAQSTSGRSFGGHLSQPNANQHTTQDTPPNRPSDTSRTNANSLPVTSDTTDVVDIASLSPQERARVVRHGAVIERATNLLGNNPTKMTAFREHITSYRTGKLSAAQFIDALLTLFSDASANALGTLVRELAELFEDKSKADDLRKAWQDWRAINEDYPSLPSLAGMQGATTPSSGWAAAAAASPAAPSATPSQKHSTRVLRLKNSTRRGSASSTSSWSSAPAIQPPSESAFPALSSTAATPASSSRAAARPSWAGTSSGTQSNPSTSSPRNANSEDAFPALPAAPKPLTTIFGYGTGSVRRDLGGNRNTGFSWGASGSVPASSGNSEREEDENAGDGAGKKKKGNKGKKQVLVQWG
jgi:E3 ubiquitin-protein ligase ZNF598